jgi:hypothetical protein
MSDRSLLPPPRAVICRFRIWNFESRILFDICRYAIVISITTRQPRRGGTKMVTGDWTASGTSDCGPRGSRSASPQPYSLTVRIGPDDSLIVQDQCQMQAQGDCIGRKALSRNKFAGNAGIPTARPRGRRTVITTATAAVGLITAGFTIVLNGIRDLKSPPQPPGKGRFGLQ